MHLLGRVDESLRLGGACAAHPIEQVEGGERKCETRVDVPTALYSGTFHQRENENHSSSSTTQSAPHTDTNAAKQYSVGTRRAAMSCDVARTRHTTTMPSTIKSPPTYALKNGESETSTGVHFTTSRPTRSSHLAIATEAVRHICRFDFLQLVPARRGGRHCDAAQVLSELLERGRSGRVSARAVQRLRPETSPDRAAS